MSVDNPNIDNIYDDDVSITYDGNPCKHVWTFGVDLVDSLANANCISIYI